MELRRITDGEATRLELAGDLDIATAPRLEALVDQLLREGRRDLVVDLTDTTLLDSTGLAALIRAARSVHGARGTMSVLSPPGSEARLVIQMSGTGGVIGLLDP
jgi:anti-sigma B factor antagonist